jgi:serine/threonine-protein kinase
MELLRGETLASYMEKKRRSSQEETLAIVLPLLSALAHAHAQGIVHRDLKPENVFLSVDPDGHVIPKVLDFGISKLLQPAAPRITTDGALLGTPSYMSPEQARGLPGIDARADVFAAGIVIYECLSGENPFASGSYHSVVAAILERDPAPLKNVSEEVWRVIRRALEKFPALRYADAGELASALTGAARVSGVQTPETSGPYPVNPSLADRSVPPAPFREQEPTTRSAYVKAKIRTRAARATVGAVGIAAALALAAGMYVRSSHAPVSAESAAPLTHPPVASTDSPPVAPSATVSAAAAAPEPPPVGAATVTIAPAPPDPAPASRPRAPPHPPHSSAKAPPVPSAPPPPPPTTPRSTVVRDPGF